MGGREHWWEVESIQFWEGNIGGRWSQTILGGNIGGRM